MGDEKKIAIVGDAGAGKTVLIEHLLSKMDDAPLIVSGFDKPVEESYIQPFVITAPPLFTEKSFICKGKHEYREVADEEGNRSWTCQCGRTL